MFDFFQRMKPERIPFDSFFEAETYLEVEGFECVRGAWMRGSNEFARITKVTPTLVTVRIGHTHL